jgi:hypothetical protein
MHYQSKRDLSACGVSGGNTLPNSLVYEILRRYHAMSNGLMTLAEDMRPKANQIIDLRLHVFNCHSDVAYSM